MVALMQHVDSFANVEAFLQDKLDQTPNKM